MKFKECSALLIGFLVTLVYVSTAFCQSKTIKISGNIGKQANFMLLDASWDSWSRKMTPYIFGNVDKAGNVNLTSDSIAEGYYTINSAAMVYLRPGMEVVLNNKGQGISCESHPYFNRLYSIYNNNILKNFANRASEMNFDEYCQQVDKHFATYKSSINVIPDQRFRQIETYNINMSKVMLKLKYRITGKKDFIPNAEYKALLKKVSFDKDFYSILPQWRVWLTDYFKIQQLDKGLSENEARELKPQLIAINNKKNKRIWAWEKISSEAFYDDITYKNALVAHKILKDKAQLQFVNTLITNVKPALKGTKFCDLKFETEQGESIDFSEFKGKTVYIDFLGVYCPACIAQLPNLSKVKKKYSDKDIVFVSVCLGDDKAKWKKLIEKHQIDCVNLLSNNNGVSGIYSISYIPHFMLLDAYGRLITAKAPRPNEKALTELLDKIL
ncbi:MAG: TlpA family protein disulfide reductase [Bacteroidales bacterium]|nr:TlpA family protein disulfide reductase [Bacteroidales bacterium]